MYRALWITERDGVTWKSPLVADKRKEKEHNEISALGFKVNNDGKDMSKEEAGEEGYQELFFTSAEGSLEPRLEVVLF